MKEDEFFIGWRDEMPAQNKKWLIRLLIPVFLFIPVLVFTIVFFTKPFSQGQFEFGKIKEFTGVYFEKPFPVLILEKGQLPPNMDLNALLVGYGKNGAKTFMDAIQKEKGDLSGRKIKIQGTLIYGDGKTLIELTNKDRSVIDVMNEPTKVALPPKPKTIVLQGEIVDPKCWFGVMKPGEGKVHKSCAIRCISGGIQPVLRVTNNGKNTYYVLEGENYEDINQEVLPYIAESVEIEGQTHQENGWNILKINPKEIKIIQ